MDGHILQRIHLDRIFQHKLDPNPSKDIYYKFLEVDMDILYRSLYPK